jgi:diketogulonate reductase-like aldo/keto reductase
MQRGRPAASVGVSTHSHAVRECRVCAQGVSNYGIHHLEELLAVCKVKPVSNQVEVAGLLALPC